MEKKERLEVPIKPNSSVAEAARRFERIALETVDRIPIKALDKARPPYLHTKNIAPTVKVNNVVATRSDDDDANMGELNEDYDFVGSTDVTTLYESYDTIYETISNESGVKKIVDEILANEELYVARLNYVINNYMIPSRLMGEQMKIIFGNIEEIKNFHENMFFPDLKRCNNDLIRIIECFSISIAAGNFYIYNVYMLNQIRSETERNKLTSKKFFQGLQNQLGDRLGVDLFLLEPSQRIFKYKNLIDSIPKKAGNELNHVEIMVATTRAYHLFNELLTTINKSMEINYIVDSKINLMSLGNFITQNEFNIYDCNQKRKYKGIIFLFQNYVVCTERTGTSQHQFRCYFPYETGRMECIDENKFELSEDNKYRIEITGTTNAIQQMMERVRHIFTPMQSNNENRSSYSSDAVIWRHSGLRSSFTYFENRTSTSDYGSRADSGEFSVTISRDNLEEQQSRNEFPQFPVPRTYVVQHSTEIIKEMLINESSYAGELTIGLQSYSALEKHADFLEIFEIFGIIQQIRNFHESTFYYILKDCENNVTKIANVFSKCAQEGQFNSYLLYAIKYTSTEALFTRRPYKEYFENRQKDSNENQGFEYYLRSPLNRHGVYKYYLDRIINSLNIDNQTTKIAAALCSKAIKDLERLINDIDSVTVERKKVTRKLTNLFSNRR